MFQGCHGRHRDLAVKCVALMNQVDSIKTRVASVRSTVILLAMAFLTIPATHAASPTKKNEVKVLLFGQPCLLQGPLDDETLRAIHSLSPEQIDSLASNQPSGDSIRKSLQKLRSAQGLPPVLDRYREKLLKRFEALLAFVDGWEAAKRSSKSSPLLKATQSLLNGKRVKDFQTLATKLDSPDSAKTGLFDSLMEIYSEMIEPDPEEEFHRAIRRLDIQYACSFDDSSKQNPPKD